MAGVRHAVAPPVPHVERVDAVVRVAGAVQVAVPLVLGELLLVAGLDLDRVGRVGEHLLEEVDVARVVNGVEVPVRRVGHDDDPALTHQRLAAVEVEVVAEPGAHHEDRVHDRVDVVRADVGQAGGDDVRLAVDEHGLLRGDVLERDLVDRAAFTAIQAGLRPLRPSARRAFFHSWRSPYELTSVQAGEVEAVHELTTEHVYQQQLVPVEGQTDVLTMGLPYICPYNVNSVMNPILVMCLGLGYFFNMYRGRPPVREGGVVIMSHPTTTTRPRCESPWQPQYHM